MLRGVARASTIMRVTAASVGQPRSQAAVHGRRQYEVRAPRAAVAPPPPFPLQRTTLERIAGHPAVRLARALPGGGDDAAPPPAIPPLKDQVEGLRSLDLPPSAAPPAQPEGRNPAYARSLWARADAVAFDIDATLCIDDALDSLGEFLGKGGAIAALTSAAMGGDLPLDVALQRRLDILDCSPGDLARWHAAHPAASRLVPGAKELVAKLRARGTAVFLISGGLREQQLPVARALGVPPSNLFANRLTWTLSDDGAFAGGGGTGGGTADPGYASDESPTRLAGFDAREPTSRNGGKPAAIAAIRAARPYDSLVMVGDGMTDAEAVVGTPPAPSSSSAARTHAPGADAFIAFTGVVARPAVIARADWAVSSFATLADALPRKRVAMVGSGAWACAASKVVAARLRDLAGPGSGEEFDPTLRMWVHEEEVDGRPLSAIINERKENVKYLPGVHLGENVVAEPDLAAAVAGADVLLLCAPHQFIGAICNRLAASGAVAPGAVACSLIKGMRVRPEGPQLISAMVRSKLGVDCSVLMGPNVAEQVAAGALTEATLGCASPGAEAVLVRLFDSASFRVTPTPDVAGVELCGSLKNVVALAAGFVDGLAEASGTPADNTKATILRAGLAEMRAFSQRLYPSVRTDTFLEACGVGDVIASALGGRNRKVAAAYAAAVAAGDPAVPVGPAGFDALEARLLAGQRLQGVLTAVEVAAVLAARGWAPHFPMMATTFAITAGKVGPDAILRYREVGPVQGVAAVEALGVKAEEPVGV